MRKLRPNLELPAVCRQAMVDRQWSEETFRLVHHEVTKTLRGLVEDAGYDPDLLPAPPELVREMDFVGGAIRITIPDAKEEATKALQQIPGAAWHAADFFWTVPVVGAALEGLRNLVRSHSVVPSTKAIEALKQVASRVQEDPLEARVADVAFENNRVLVRLVAPYPLFADSLKRIPSLKWDSALNGYSAPGGRLRDVVAACKTFLVRLEPSAQEKLNEQDAPFSYDGTLDGLRGVPVSELNHVGPKRTERLADFGVESVFDLLMLTPRRYLDRSNLRTIRSLTAGEEVGLLATITNIMSDPKKRLVRITVADASGKLTATYFNAIWQAKRFRVGDEVSIWGKVESWQGSSRAMLSLTNPIMDPVGDQTLPVIPIYPQSAKSRITTWEIQAAVGEALRRLGTLVDPLPPVVIEGLELLGRQEALQEIHRPTSLELAEKARQRLSFDELFRMQAALLMRKATEELEAGISHAPSGVLTKALTRSLPYDLTGAQQRALTEIATDMISAHPMHRLLQGDVGSGKTVVAAATLLTGCEGGYQGALMAPTEILAWQLYNELVERTSGLLAVDGTPLRVEFFSNKLRGKARDKALSDLAAGVINIAVGTHALLVEDVCFHNLGIVVVDEQHRFGVEQRAALRAKGPVRGEVQLRPDMLVMTATPIPRTASMTIFGDLDISILDEMPPGRTPIETSWLDSSPDLLTTHRDPWPLVVEQVKAGRQAYVVCPLVEESEKLQVASATETFESLQLGALSGLRLGLVHGQQPAEERSKTMAAFRNGDLDVLVATTVIEVGVNVPNASVIVILDSGRFGIAQLHQLRGRVGRGVHASYCVLYGRVPGTEGRARMEALVESTDGFYLSEVDLNLRGHGQVFGTMQSGASDLRVADLDNDRELLEIARVRASELIDEDPSLSRRPALRAEIVAVLGEGAAEWLAKS